MFNGLRSFDKFYCIKEGNAATRRYAPQRQNRRRWEACRPTTLVSAVHHISRRLGCFPSAVIIRRRRRIVTDDGPILVTGADAA
uniref:Uncharacterized protein n=1 Tax=Romanomermis culicivorax TaxID=13658 RepID=A0A915KJ73_ROMCU